MAQRPPDSSLSAVGWARRLARHLLSRGQEVLVSWVFLVADRFLSVRDDYWCFCTWPWYPHTLDNPRAVFEEVRGDADITKIILQRHQGPLPTGEPTKVIAVPAESWRGAVFLARSRVVVLGYSMIMMASYSKLLRRPRHQVVQLLHGVPLKRVGRLSGAAGYWEAETLHYAAVPSSSPRDAEIHREAFAPVPHTWLTGLPRNDLILKPEAELPTDYQRQLADLDTRLRGRRLVLYAPTWRADPGELRGFTAAQEKTLSGLMQRHNGVLGIRAHPNARRHQVYAELEESEVILDLTDLPEANLILRRAQVLVTDYSSIYIDFLLLDRPVLHFAYDMNSYQSTRGLLYRPEEAFGGPCLTTFEDLIEALETVLVNPAAHQAERAAATRLFHAHPGASAQAVAGLIRQLVVSPGG